MADNKSMEEEMALNSGIAAFEAKHFVRAAELLEPLAEAGNAEAQYRVAIMAQNGLGMVENQLQAYKNMKAAAEAGCLLPSMASVSCTWKANAWTRMARRRWRGS